MNARPHTPPPLNPPAWMRWVLIVAGLYNIAWGLFAGLFPSAAFRWAGMEVPNYPFLWQCIGMIVGVYGIGYLAASRNAYVHWPIVLVGLLGKILGPIGFADALRQGIVTPAFGVNIIFNDLIWWVPFGLMLWGAAKSHQARGDGSVVPLAEALERFPVHGASSTPTLAAYTQEQPALVVFLRHLGCTFCREALADLGKQKDAIAAKNMRLVLVHMSPPDEAAAFFARYDLGPYAHVSDPEAVLYRSFGLSRGTLWQLFGPASWIRGMQATLAGHIVGPLQGDGFQMPGAFVLWRGRVVAAHKHATAADRPDYRELASCPIPR